MISDGIVGFSLVNGWNAALISTARTLVDASKEYSLTVIPLFLLMGNLIARARFAEDLYNACFSWIGHRRGGLARATILSCAAFSAVCGSSLATTATMSRVALPSMSRLGYAPSLAAGFIAAGGTLGIKNVFTQPGSKAAVRNIGSLRLLHPRKRTSPIRRQQARHARICTAHGLNAAPATPFISDGPSRSQAKSEPHREFWRAFSPIRSVG